MTFIKILNTAETHNGFTYQTGENVCPDFEPTRTCGHGLHYTHVQRWLNWTHFGDHFREVLAAIDEIEIDENKSKARVLVLGPPRPFSDLMPTEADQLEAVGLVGRAVRFLPAPSEAVQLAAVRKDPAALEFCGGASEAVQLAAVEICGTAIRFVRDPTAAVQLAAVRQNASALRCIENPCPAAVDACAFHFNIADQQPTGYINFQRIPLTP